MQEKERAWVFGASGLTGQGLVKALRDSGIPTTAHLRPNSSSHYHVTPMFQTYGAETKLVAWHEPEIRSALRQQPPSVVFLSLGTTRSRSRVDGEGYQKVDYGYTKMVIDAVLTEHKTCKLVYVSAIPGGASEYFRVRTQLETYLKESGAKVLIARPSLIIGERLDKRPWEHRAAKILDTCLGGLRAIGLGSVSDRFESMSGDALGMGIVQLYLESYEQTIAEVATIRAASDRFRVC